MTLALEINQAFADQENPLENLGTFTAKEIKICMMRENNPFTCFKTVVDSCNNYVSGFAHNIYPCSINTRTALRELAEHRIHLRFSEGAVLAEFQTSQRLGYEMCNRLDHLAGKMGQLRVGTQGEGCLNEVTIRFATEIWDAVQF